MFRVIAAVAFLAAASACQPSWSIHGQVAVAPAATAGADEQPQPLPGAKVILRCPGVKDRVVVADPMGAFEIAGTGAGPVLECVLIATHPGHAPYAASLDDACADDGEGDGRCVSAALLATLEPLR